MILDHNQASRQCLTYEVKKDNSDLFPIKYLDLHLKQNNQYDEENTFYENNQLHREVFAM